VSYVSWRDNTDTLWVPHEVFNDSTALRRRQVHKEGNRKVRAIPTRKGVACQRPNTPTDFYYIKLDKIMKKPQMSVTGSILPNKVPLFSKFVGFSVTLFLIILVVASVAFLFSMQQIIRNNKASVLTKLLEVEKIKLETSVDREIAIVLKKATSPLIQRYFETPGDIRLKRMALDEIKAYRVALKSGTAFWMSDIDKMFYMNDQLPYLVDPDAPENYWYSLTLEKTETYNFNINFNPDLHMINLWINAPVYNDERKAIGLVGTGIDLSSFVNSIYKGDHGNAKLYFFNKVGEITGAENVRLITAKKNINEELIHIDDDILEKANSLKPGEVRTFGVSNGKAAIISIPMLEWYAIAVLPDSIDDFKTALTVFFLSGILGILFILIVICIFVFKLLKTLQHAKASIEDQNQIIMSGIKYASQIQRNLLPPARALAQVFEDYSTIWEPRDVVGGDIYWMKQFEKGTILCVCDCTGHGTPGALLTMLVVSALESTVWPSNCDDTAGVIWQVDKRLKGVFNVNDADIKDGCDIAVLFIAKNGDVTISSGHTNVFICNGRKVRRIKGQRIFVGEGGLKSKDDVKAIHIPYDSDNKFYIGSDGLFDQPGGKLLAPFGYKAFEKIILENHMDNQNSISGKIWAAFQKYRGSEPRVDDFELITFKPNGENT